jgi:hypothetical protein
MRNAKDASRCILTIGRWIMTEGDIQRMVEAFAAALRAGGSGSCCSTGEKAAEAESRSQAQDCCREGAGEHVIKVVRTKGAGCVCLCLGEQGAGE